MKKRIFKWILTVCLLLLIFPSVQIVKADDDDDDERYEKYERKDDWKSKKYEWEDEDVDEEEWEDDDDWEKEGNQTSLPDSQMQPSFWNVWTRDSSTSLTENLPFQEAKEVTVDINGKSESLYVVPMNGQLLVSAEKTAKLLGLEAKFYKQSRILEVSNDKEELIVRAGTNVAYENMVKTPMPAKALYYEKSVFVPISVIANAFGYRVNWDEATGTITLNEIN
jgi:hypothetical protein